jgi:hypothetical protein
MYKDEIAAGFAAMVYGYVGGLYNLSGDVLTGDAPRVPGRYDGRLLPVDD